jgi:hypothetical protein
MADISSLVQMFNDGKLGDLLVERFCGEIGHRFPKKDADSIISFQSQEATPGANEIRNTVKSYYEKLGYVVETVATDGKNCVGLIIRNPNHRLGFVSVIITTPYPHGGNHRNVRMTCEIHA